MKSLERFTTMTADTTERVEIWLLLMQLPLTSTIVRLRERSKLVKIGMQSQLVSTHHKRETTFPPAALYGC